MSETTKKASQNMKRTTNIIHTCTCISNNRNLAQSCLVDNCFFALIQLLINNNINIKLTKARKKILLSHQMHLANSIRHQETFFYVDVVVLHVELRVKSLFFAPDFVDQAAHEKQVFFSDLIIIIIK